MTVITKNRNPFTGLLVFLSIVVILVIGVTSIGGTERQPDTTGTFVFEAYSLSTAQLRIIELVSGHAWQNHGAEVNEAFRCLDDKGTSRSFKTSGLLDEATNSIIPTNVWLCTNGTDWYAIVTTTFRKIGNDNVARLVTAYKVTKDIFPTIDDFVDYIVLKWGAYEISYVIQAGSNILLDPK